MDDQNKTTQGSSGKGPISSGIAPGPGEHYADDVTQHAATSGRLDEYDATSGAGMNAGSRRRAPVQGDARAWHWPTSETMNAGDTQSLQSRTGSRDTLLNRAQERVRGSKAIFLAGTVVAGFLLQRVLQSTPARASGGQGRMYGTADQYGTDASLDDDRKYGIDTAYSPYSDDTSYQSAYGTGKSASGTMSRIAERMRQAGDGARSRLQATKSDARARWHDARHATKDQYYRARQRVDTMADERPLLIGVLGLAAGAGLGAMIAATRRENQLMGDLRDKVVGKAKETASGRMQSLKQSAQKFAEFAKEEVQREKERVGSAAAQSMRNAGSSPADRTRI